MEPCGCRGLMVSCWGGAGSEVPAPRQRKSGGLSALSTPSDGSSEVPVPRQRKSGGLNTLSTPRDGSNVLSTRARVLRVALVAAEA